MYPAVRVRLSRVFERCVLMVSLQALITWSLVHRFDTLAFMPVRILIDLGFSSFISECVLQNAESQHEPSARSCGE